MKPVLVEVEKAKPRLLDGHRRRGYLGISGSAIHSWSRAAALARTLAKSKSTSRQTRSVPARQGRSRCCDRTKQGAARAIFQ